MPIEKWRPILLAVLAVALAGVIYVEWPRPADAAKATSTPKAAGGRAPSATTTLTAPDVHLKSLEEEHTKPGDIERDLFRFKTRLAPPPTTRPAVAIAPPPVVPSGPPPPPPLPPIALRFIGVLESANTQKIAVLSDGRGAPLYGKEGDTVLGQYKILHIGVESIEMAYLDGRGRQTIRLSGS
ncbi:MAG TPA: hypothetical protein VF456_06985 [Vicinamibacterales bacterium]